MNHDASGKLLFEFLTVAMLLGCAPLHIGNHFTMRGPAPTATDHPRYTITALPPGVVEYAVRGETWPVGKFETGRVWRAVFVRSTERIK